MLACQSNIATAPPAPMPPVSSSAPDLSRVATLQQFAAQVIGRAALSLAASRVAVDKAARADVKEFAGYELLEARTVVAVLKDLGAKVPAMSLDAKATLDQIVNASPGGALDTAYMTVEYENHAFLKDLAAAYLKNSDPNASDIIEQHGRQLASVAYFAFTEHTGITRRILRELALRSDLGIRGTCQHLRGDPRPSFD
jgi:putative membrane protein